MNHTANAKKTLSKSLNKKIPLKQELQGEIAIKMLILRS